VRKGEWGKSLTIEKTESEEKIKVNPQEQEAMIQMDGTNE